MVGEGATAVCLDKENPSPALNWLLTAAYGQACGCGEAEEPSRGPWGTVSLGQEQQGEHRLPGAQGPGRAAGWAIDDAEGPLPLLKERSKSLRTVENTVQVKHTSKALTSPHCEQDWVSPPQVAQRSERCLFVKRNKICFYQQESLATLKNKLDTRNNNKKGSIMKWK